MDFRPQAAADGIIASVTVAGVTANKVNGVLAARTADNKQCLITNVGTGVAYINFGAHAGANLLRDAVVADGLPLAAGQRIILTLELWITDVSVITVGAASNVIFTLGSTQ